MSKKFLYLMVLFCSINLNNFAISEIIPPKKPIQTKEETQKKLLIDVLKPSLLGGETIQGLGDSTQMTGLKHAISNTDNRRT